MTWKAILCFYQSFKRRKACNFIEKDSLAQLFSCTFGKISKNTFFYRTPPVANSVSKVIPKRLTEFFGLMSTSLIQMVKSSGMVLFLYDTKISWNLFEFTIILFAFSQFMVVIWDSSMSMSISELGSDDYSVKYYHLRS